MIFDGIKILDLTRILSGPLATRHFAVQGAQVIKIESPDGDDTRYFPPLIDNWSGYFEILNHNKKSVVLDLKLDEDLIRFYILCKNADVVVENFSPSVKNKLKIDYDTIKKINPKIIYASICGVIPNENRKYYDIIAQAESGLISLNQTNKTTAIVDSFAAMKLAFAIAGCLYNKEKNNVGVNITVSMLGSAFDLLEHNLIEASVTKPETKILKSKNVYQQDTAICPFGIFYTQTSDIAIAIGNENLWKVFCEFLSNNGSDYEFQKYNSNQKRLNDKELIYKQIQTILDNMSAQQIYDECIELGIASGIVSDIKEIIDNDFYFENKLLQKINIPKIGNVSVPTCGIYFENNPNVDYIAAPQLNQHSDEF